MTSMKEDPWKLPPVSSISCFMCAFPYGDFLLCVFVGLNCRCDCDNFLNPGNPSEVSKLGVLLSLLTCGYKCDCKHCLFLPEVHALVTNPTV